MAVKSWIEGDETASEMLFRVSKERPFLLLPPLHRLPLRVGNVVELVGPSSSTKTLILMQAIMTCVLPKEWNGVKYGGLGRLVMFIDLDCRFDILCLSDMLRQRIMEASGLTSETNVAYVEELHVLCLRRFLYTRCYDSFEFLATLKTLHRQLGKVREAENNSVYLLMIDRPSGPLMSVDFVYPIIVKNLHNPQTDVNHNTGGEVFLSKKDVSFLEKFLFAKTNTLSSIGAFHWVDRASTITLSANTNRKSLSLQSVSETVVQEMKKVLLVHPMLVIATKAISLGDQFSSNDAQWKKSFQAFPESKKGTSSSHKPPYREFMPAVWQSFVTHKILVRSSDDHLNEKHNQICPVYLAEWLLPPLSVVDRFVVKHGFVHVV